MEDDEHRRDLEIVPVDQCHAAVISVVDATVRFMNTTASIIQCPVHKLNCKSIQSTYARTCATRRVFQTHNTHVVCVGVR